MPYTNGIAETTETMDYVFLQPKILSKVALTQGDWEALGQNLWVDNDRQLVYFMGLKETPLEKHLYVVSLRRPGEVRLLTRPGFSYAVDFSKVSFENFKVNKDIDYVVPSGLLHDRNGIQ